MEWAAVMIDEKEEELIECDSLILSVGYYPEIDLLRGLLVMVLMLLVQITYHKVRLLF